MKATLHLCGDTWVMEHGEEAETCTHDNCHIVQIGERVWVCDLCGRRGASHTFGCRVGESTRHPALLRKRDT